ncbi:MAG: hypothetical protein AABY03_00365 [Nanoarchaeota archaeon]
MASSLELQLQEVREKEVGILKKIDESRARKKIECAAKNCGKLHTVNKLTLIQTHWYVSPRECTEGDYWTEGELRFICPDTKTVNRIMIDNYDVPYEDRDKLENDPESQFRYNYNSLFKEVIDVHKHGSTSYGGGYETWSRGDEKKDMSPEEVAELANGTLVNNYYVDRNRKKFGLVERRKSGEFLQE